VLTSNAGSFAETKSLSSNLHSLKLISSKATNAMAFRIVLFFKSKRVVVHKPLRAGVMGKMRETDGINDLP
jgi:hypothetical protein